MKLLDALKSSIQDQNKYKKNEEKPSLLDILRKRNRDMEIRGYRKILLRRIGKR